jgi:alanyl-tRNA synthetase
MNRPITARQLRSTYLEFFRQKGHAVIPSASLVPANDPSVLFTTAGMHPLVPHLLGEPHPAGRRLVGAQKCVRTGDVEVVGDDTHLTCFEMLGNWSLGDYFRQEAISWSFELLTSERWLGLSVDRLGISCFAGHDSLPPDQESAQLWQSLGIPRQRVAFLGREHNWWGPAGKTGPCGPDTEIFYWVSDQPPPAHYDPDDQRWVEIWNNVFMGYTQAATGEITPLDRVNVDTGMGVERTLVALNGLLSVYDVDTVRPLMDELRSMVTASPRDRSREPEHKLRVLTDHLRAAAFIIADGVGPSNKDQGYVLRRLLRRSMLFARQLGMPDDWYHRGLSVLESTVGDDHPELVRDPGLTRQTIGGELSKFERTLAQGLRVLEKRREAIDGRAAFDLFQTYGFPLELTRELAAAKGKTVDEQGFREELERHRQLSRTTSAGSFEGGLADRSVEIVRYHTLTHLLQAALRQVLGEQVVQRGSNITHERLRFDFPHDGKMTPEQIAAVEALVNSWLARDLDVERATMTEGEARRLGALGAFGEKYGDTVSVYTVSDRRSGEVISREFCGGPHVASSAELPGHFRIVREEAISAGIRRIKAVLDPAISIPSPHPRGEG